MSDEEESTSGHWSSMPIESLNDFNEFLHGLCNETRSSIDWGSTMKTIADSIQKFNDIQIDFVYQITSVLVRKRAPIKFLKQLLQRLFPDGVRTNRRFGDIYESLMDDACHGDSTDPEMIHFLLDKLHDNYDPLLWIDFWQVNLGTLQIIAQHPHTIFRLRHVHDMLHDFKYLDNKEKLFRKIEFIMDHASDRQYVASQCMLHRFIGNYCSGESRKWSGYFLRNLEGLFASILMHYPNDVWTKDFDGNLPLTLVCERMTGWYADPNLGDGKDIQSAEIVRLLLEAYPEAALIPNNTGKLAIHLAIENGLAATDILIEKAPACLDIPCPASGLYPAQLAAIDWSLHKPDSEVLESIYNLIRRSPMAVAHHGMTSSENATSLLDNPDYKMLCQGEMQLARLGRRQKRERESLQQKQNVETDAEVEKCKRLRTKWNDDKNK